MTLTTPLPRTESTPVFASLPPLEPGTWNEARQFDGGLRPIWQQFAGRLAHHESPSTMDGRRQAIARQIHLDGLTHNIHGDGQRSPRAWSLELLPMIVEASDWSVIEAGVVQQARLLQALMADLYGPRRTVAEGLLPAALLYRHRGYLRALDGVQPVGGRHLHVAAFDVARGSDGQWCIVSRRTQSPSGLGYALHNRSVVSRMFFDAYRDLHVRPLGDALTHLTQTVRDMASHLSPGSSPRVVLLTPGATDASWFEHAYLARQMGATLVHGGDLTVRDDCLYLKTVQGLERVHGVLRRVDDAEVDPLELDAGSSLGVPGLVQVLRAGKVAMLNALGSGVLESPALEGFLPGLAKLLLGESLMLPSLDSWWCGEAAAWQSVRRLLNQKVVRPSYPGEGETWGARAHWVDGSSLGEWQARIDDDPQAWTVQSPLSFSRTLLWQDGQWASRPALLRVYAMADVRGHWHVMPGGMTQLAAQWPAPLSMDQGGRSLDTWVIGATMAMSRPAASVALPPRVASDVADRRHPPVASRTAETLFWLGRYSERAEQAVRLLRAIMDRVHADQDAAPSLVDAMALMAVEATLADAHRLKSASTASLAHAILETVIQGRAGIAEHVRSLVATAAELPDHLSPEHATLVRGLNDNFAADLRQPAGLSSPAVHPAALTLGHVRTALDRLGLRLAANNGMQGDHMTRDLSWRYLAIGRQIERLQRLAETMVALERAQALATTSGVALLLQLFDSTMTYNARYHRHGDLLATTDLLVCDDNNPRSYAAVVGQMLDDLKRLPQGASMVETWVASSPPLTAYAIDQVRGLDDQALSTYLAGLSRQLIASSSGLSDAIGRRYFVHAVGHDRMQRA